MESFDDAGSAAASNAIRRGAILSRLLVLCAYSAAIIYFGTRKQLAFPGDSVLSHDKLLHAVAFGGVGALSYRLLRYALPDQRQSQVVLESIGVAFILGASLEIIQARLPYRSMEFADLLADTIGAVLFVALAQWLRFDRELIRVPRA
jgi:VanZ family protein